MVTGNENPNTAVTPALLDQLRDSHGADALSKIATEAATADFNSRLRTTPRGHRRLWSVQDVATGRITFQVEKNVQEI